MNVVNFNNKEKICLADLPEPFNSNPELLDQSKIVADSLSSETFLVTQNMTFQLKWLLTTNSVFLYDNDVSNQVDRYLELTRVMPNFYQLSTISRQNILSSDDEYFEFLSKTQPQTIPTVGQVAQIILRYFIEETSLEIVIQQLEEVFASIGFDQQLQYLFRQVDNTQFNYKEALEQKFEINHQSYVIFDVYKAISAILYDFAVKNKIFTFQQIMNFYNNINIPVSTSLKAVQNTFDDQFLLNNQLSHHFFHEILKFNENRIWGCGAPEKSCSQTQIVYFQRDMLSFDFKKRLYQLFQNLTFWNYEDLRILCSDCLVDANSGMNKFTYEVEIEGEKWCGIRKQYEFLK